jgi:chromosomal replication initiation ATPase DnaA
MPRPTIEQILAAASEHFGVGVAEMMSEGRCRRMQRVCMWLAARLTHHSLAQIATRLDRDYDNVVLAVRVIDRDLPRDEELAADVAALTRQLAGG